MSLVLSNKGKGMQSSSEQPLVGEERYVTTRITAAKETRTLKKTHHFVRKMKVRKKDRKQFPRIFPPMSLDTSFCSYNAFHWTRNSYTSANDVTDKKLRARLIDRIPE